MSENYSPADGAIPGYPYTTRVMSQRDLGVTVPINHVTVPGISLSAGCFSQLRYENDDAALCLSNLLAVGFQRFEVDLYWDDAKQVWSLCPVAVPDASSMKEKLLSKASTLPPSSGTPVVAEFQNPVSTSRGSNVIAQQLSSSNNSSSTFSSTSSSAVLQAEVSSLGQDLPSYSSLPDSPDNSLLSIGPFSCTETMGISTITSQLLNYIQRTENTVAANLLYLILNVHAATSSSSASSSAPKPLKLPQNSNLLSSQFSANLTRFLYTPLSLLEDRADLTNSWFRVNEVYRPLTEYYTTVTNQYGFISTKDGWPSEGYVEFSRSKRLLIGFGTSDPQMQSYNFTADEGTIFPSGDIHSSKTNIAASVSGHVTNGCLISQTGNSSQGNSSWAQVSNLSGFMYPTTPTSDMSPLLNLSKSITRCGISSFLNVTLLGTSAASHYVPYQSYTNSTIWSWGPNEPRNFTGGVDSNSANLFRCATASLSLDGGWAVSDCSVKNFAACRAHSQPYNWTIATYQVSYTYASSTCPNGYVFAVPRTALENSYLTQAMKRRERDFGLKSGAWVDFNSLDFEGCWVAGGPNVTCPYRLSASYTESLARIHVLVPTIAAIIVLIITALTMFAKAAGTRSRRKVTKKRAHNGFIHEGVPL